MKFRIAPTPSGYLHIGNICNFVFNWACAKQLNAQVYLRIDDMDLQRSRDTFIQDIFNVLEYLEIDYIGPKNLHDFKTNYSFSKQIENCRRQANKLAQMKKTYFCQCSRKDFIDYDLYPKNCLNKNLSFKRDETSQRLITAEDDFIIWRKDDLPSYQLASVLEDERLGITHIIRGEDLSDSTKKQLLLASSLELKSFSRIKFHHHELLTNQGEKISKSSQKQAHSLTDKSRKEIFEEITEFFQIPKGAKISKLSEIIPMIKQPW